MTMLGHCNLLKEEHAASPKKANKHGSNNTTVEITEWHGRNGSKIMEGAKSGLKRGESTIK